MEERFTCSIGPPQKTTVVLEETVLVTVSLMLLPQDSMKPEILAICAAGDVLGLCSLRGHPDMNGKCSHQGPC